MELWSYEFPLDAASVPDGSPPAFARSPQLLDQAKRNLVGNKADLWTFGDAQRSSSRAGDLASLLPRSAPVPPGTLQADVAAREGGDRRVRARGSTRRRRRRRAPSGIGVENYDWYLKNVQLVPYTWQDEVAT